MTVLQEYDAFNTTIVSKQEIENEKISTTSIRQDLINGELQKANDALGYIYSIKGTVVQGEKGEELLASQQLTFNLVMIICCLVKVFMLLVLKSALKINYIEGS